MHLDNACAAFHYSPTGFETKIYVATWINLFSEIQKTNLRDNAGTLTKIKESIFDHLVTFTILLSNKFQTMKLC